MKMKNLKEKMFLLTSFHMNNEQLFWYIRIKKMLEKEFDDQSEEYIEMIADEYFEEHFMEEDE